MPANQGLYGIRSPLPFSKAQICSQKTWHTKSKNNVYKNPRLGHMKRLGWGWGWSSIYGERLLLASSREARQHMLQRNWCFAQSAIGRADPTFPPRDVGCSSLLQALSTKPVLQSIFSVHCGGRCGDFRSCSCLATTKALVEMMSLRARTPRRWGNWFPSVLLPLYSLALLLCRQHEACASGHAQAEGNPYQIKPESQKRKGLKSRDARVRYYASLHFSVINFLKGDWWLALWKARAATTLGIRRTITLTQKRRRRDLSPPQQDWPPKPHGVTFESLCRRKYALQNLINCQKNFSCHVMCYRAELRISTKHVFGL